MVVYYANVSIVQFRAIMLGIHVYVYIGYMVIYIYTVSNFVQYVVTIAKLNLCLYTIFISYFRWEHWSKLLSNYNILNY